MLIWCLDSYVYGKVSKIVLQKHLRSKGEANTFKRNLSGLLDSPRGRTLQRDFLTVTMCIPRIKVYLSLKKESIL